MKFLALFLFVFVYQSFSASLAQEVKVSLYCKNVSLEQVILDLKKQTKLNYFYKKDDLVKYESINADFKDELLTSVLSKLLKTTDLDYEISNNIILISKSKKNKALQTNKIKGKVVDKDGKPLPGVTVLVKGTSQGVSSDLDGNFVIVLPKIKDISLVFTFIGMKSQTIKITNQKQLEVVMEEESAQMEEVVVNGYFTRSKETFTGVTTTISGEEIQAISSTNLIKAIVALTPGMHIVENNEQGSNPNAIPQIIIRGTTSLIDEDNQGANNPLIVLDGVEITMEELYDLEIEDIDRIDILKDAAATSIYGDKAANGVIVVTRKRVKDPKLQIRYNFTPNYSIPDIRSINLCNARQKLELERLAGLYDKYPNGSLDMAYAKKLTDVNNGIDTDWISKPLRVSFSHNHALSLSGRANTISYRVSANFKDTYGVMKGDNRNTYNFSVYLGYFKSEKLRVNFRSGFSLLNSKNSPYGNFSQYSAMNPYNPVYDEYGDYIKKYYFDPYSSSSSSDAQGNPLYDASLSSFDKRKSLSITNSLDAKWEINKDLVLTSQLSYNTNFSQGDKYVSPDNSAYLDERLLVDRGEYTINGSNGYALSAKVGFNYRILFNEGTAFRLNAGAEVSKNKSNTHTSTGFGFKKDWMSDLRFATISESTGHESVSSNVGVYGSASFTFKNRYNFDANCRTSGSSKYGKENKWGPFWSGGFSWNLHKESFLDYDWLTSLRLRVSAGYTGSSSFDPYQAITVYEYKNGLDQYTGIGAIPINMGNADLKWQRTFNKNFGITASLFNNRFSFGFDYYVQETKDVVMSISVPPSIGTENVNVNYGEIVNKGYDISVSGQIIKNNDVYWSVSLTGAHVFDRLEKLSDDVLKQNDDNEANKQDEPNLLLREGGSQYDIYGVRSAGIDPATGNEIFIDRFGDYTFKYDVLDKVALGNTNPTLRGSINTGFSYKNFSVNISSQYTFGSDKYNSTLLKKVESIDPYKNVDERAFTERWKQPGDVTRFIGIQQGAALEENRYTSRFVEKYDELYISSINFAYEFKPEFLKKWGVKKLKIGYGMSDVVRFSTMKYERGTSYPYCRSFNITIKPTF